MLAMSLKIGILLCMSVSDSKCIKIASTIYQSKNLERINVNK